ncbi:hypothetical protein JCM3770_003510 [Rhodotorula araucariae]
MSSSCEVVPGSSGVFTVVSTSTVYGTALSTAPASTVTTSTPVVTSNCALPTAVGELALCETTTSFVAVQTVLPVRTSAPHLYVASTSVTYATTTITSTPSTPSPSVDSLVRSISSLPFESPSTNPLSVADDTPPTNVRRTTSYVTSWVTVVDNAGRTVSSATAVPTLLNEPNTSSSSSHTGAIAGGTVGGVAALALAGFIFWLMRKRGYFRKGDEEIEEDVWNPAAHAGYFGGNLARRNGGGGGGGAAAAAAATGLSAGGRSSPDEKGDGVSDEDRLVDAATLERHQSWYNSLRGRGGELDPEAAYGGEMAERVPSPPVSELGAFSPLPLAPASPRSTASHGPQRSMSLSNRLSVHSHSSYSHEGHVYPAGLPHVAIPDHRLSQLSQYAHWHSYAPPPMSPLPAGYPDDPTRYASRSPPPHSLSHASLEHARSTSPPIFPLAPTGYMGSSSPPNPTLARQRSLPGLSIPAHLRSASYGPQRPQIDALQHARARSSGDAPVRARTVNSLSSGSRLASGSPLQTPSSAHSSHAPSLSMPALTHADSDATLATTPSSISHSNSLKMAMVTAPAAPVPVHATLERLKRPPLGRADSAESFLAPSQWLGARVVNADDDDDDASTVASAPGRSAESLPGGGAREVTAHPR